MRLCIFCADSGCDQDMDVPYVVVAYDAPIMAYVNIAAAFRDQVRCVTCCTFTRDGHRYAASNRVRKAGAYRASH